MCGVADDRPGLGTRRPDGWAGFDVDFCRAFAAATLLDADKVELIPLGGKDRLQPLTEGQIDVVARHPSGAVGLDPDRKTAFAGFSLWDGQAFLVPAARLLSNARELNGTTICVADNDAAELANFMSAVGLAATAVPSETLAGAATAYLAGNCDVLTAGRLALSRVRAESDQAEAHAFLPDNISKVLMGPFVRADDPAWLDIIRWTVFAVIEAEERGVTAANAEELRDSSQDGKVLRLLGVESEFGKALGLAPQWAFEAIRQVGNYQEIYERNLGQGSALGLERGPNALWSDGGLLQAMPFQ